MHEDTSYAGAHTVELRLGVSEQKRDAAQARVLLTELGMLVGSGGLGRAGASGPPALRANPTPRRRST